MWEADAGIDDEAYVVIVMIIAIPPYVCRRQMQEMLKGRRSRQEQCRTSVARSQ